MLIDIKFKHFDKFPNRNRMIFVKYSQTFRRGLEPYKVWKPANIRSRKIPEASYYIVLFWKNKSYLMINRSLPLVHNFETFGDI